MKKKGFGGSQFWLLLSILWLFFALTGCNPGTAESVVQKQTKDMFAMDTYMTFSAYGEKAQEALALAQKEITRLDELLSTGKEDSEVSVLNREGRAVLSEDLTKLWDTAADLYRESNGCFDVTIYPIMRLWGFYGDKQAVPEEEMLKKLLKNVDTAKVTWDARSQNIGLPEGIQVDFGALGKGYAGECIAKIWKSAGVSGILNLGGNIQTVGEKPDGSPFFVAIQDPLGQRESIGILQVGETAVVTSGGYERYFEEKGKKYHHLIHPKTGYPAESGLLSVTIVCKSGTLADGYSTALYVMGLEDAIKLWRAKEGAFEAVFLTEEGKLLVTEGLKDCFESDLEYEVIPY